MQEELERKHELKQEHSRLPFTTGPQRINRSLYDRLCGDNHSLYDFHKRHSFEELLAMDGVGKTTAVALKHQGQYHANDETDEMDSCVVAVCPDCNAEWKAPIFPDMNSDEYSPNHILYCPNCGTADIPPAYISDPQPFNPTEKVTKYDVLPP